MRAMLLEKTQRKLSLNLPNYTYDEETLGDYFDDAVSIIKDWKRNYNDSLVLSGNYDTAIIQFVIESIGVSGIEGQSSSTANGNKKVFFATPEDNLKAKIPQGL